MQLAQSGAIWQSLRTEAAAAQAAAALADAPAPPNTARQESKEPGAMDGVWAALLKGIVAQEGARTLESP